MCTMGILTTCPTASNFATHLQLIKQTSHHMMRLKICFSHCSTAHGTACTPVKSLTNTIPTKHVLARLPTAENRVHEHIVAYWTTKCS
mmetsp:Transcript_96546/g.185385  ORF Transcript_96546/g.185385 Transcript_96546/m.185385 type:complete len:88 (-) Transcript_96546:9-272(-)